MRPLGLCLALAAAALSLPLAAQGGNLVRNGDFSLPVLTPWQAQSYALNPGLDNADVNATGTSQCYAATPGGQTNTPPFPVHQLQQSVVVPGVALELTLDAMQQGLGISITPSPPMLEVYLGTQLLASKSFTLLKRPVKRERIAVRFTPTTPGQQLLSVEFKYQSQARANGPRIHVDNVGLRIFRDPMWSIRGERLLGGTVSFEALGTANAAFLILVSPGLLPQPVPIPGFSGELALDVTGIVPFLSGALDGQGLLALTLKVPDLAGLVGVPLYWQGIQASAQGNGFGWESQQAFYK